MINNALSQMVLDTLEQQIAVIDKQGIIVYTNKAWQLSGTNENISMTRLSVGSNFLHACQQMTQSGFSIMVEAVEGLKAVLERRSFHYQLEYPSYIVGCEGWYAMNITALQGIRSDLSVVTRQDITQRKQAQQKATHMAKHDPLTGLANRLYMREFLRQKWNHCQLYRAPMSMILIDIDQFKRFNKTDDAFGDDCLVSIGQVLKNLTRRQDDLAVRYGSAEFLLILSNYNQEQTDCLGHLLRTGVEELGLSSQDQKPVTISVGAVTFQPSPHVHIQSVFQAAEQALSQAQRVGGNCVIRTMLEITPMKA